MANNESVSLYDAFTKLSDKLINIDVDANLELIDKLKRTSFFEFVRDYWSQGYERPDLFNLWHIKLLCEDVENAIKDGKHYVAVIPRGHYKSTVLGHAFTVWRFLTSERDIEVVYLSYSEQMAQRYHIAQMKKFIRSNCYLNSIMKDKAPNSDFAFRYKIGSKNVEVIPAGIFSFKRGTHVNGALIADDLLRDPQNPLMPTQLLSVEETFFREALYIPNPGVPIIAMGTPMSPDDLLAKLQDDERFYKRVLPVFNPIPDVKVLAPEIRNEEWLLVEAKERPKSFATEFMLAPFSSVTAYLNEQEISSVENEELKLFNPYDVYFDKKPGDYVVAGLDIGKKRHPSHLVIFKGNEQDNKIIQLNSTFLDGWDYSKQANFINSVTKNFGIDRGYFDNTRSELEDRDLDNVWTPMVFSNRNKRKMAQTLENYVVNDRIELIPDIRQRSQIICVDIDLNSPNTPLGHGESFWSVALAAVAYQDATLGGTQDIGDMGSWIQAGDYKSGPIGPNYKKSTDDNEYCIECGESVGWVKEKKLCIICYWENKENEWRELEVRMNMETYENYPTIS